MLKNLALFAASVTVVLLAVEVALRIAGVSYPSFYIEDRELGGRLRPGAEGWTRGEGGAYVRINSDGMRDREHAAAKPPGTLRVAVLGDSFAEAMAIPLEKTFWSVLERRLSRCAGEVEVLNFGVSGYGTAQELIMLRDRVWKYSPDIVLLAFFTGNDVRNNSSALNRDPHTPYFVYRDGRLTLDDSFRRSLASLGWSPAQRAVRDLAASVRNDLRVLQVADQARTAFRRREDAKAPDMASAESVAMKGGEAGLDNAVYAEPKDDRWKEAWSVTEGLIVEMANEVRSHAAKFWVVTLSTGIQVYPDPAVRSEFMKRLGVKDLLYPDMRVKALCDREGIPIVTLAPAMAKYAEKHGVFLHGFENAIMGFGHWNEAGHRVAGELIAAQLCASARSAGR